MSSNSQNPAVVWKEEQERSEEYGKGGYHFVRIGDTFCDNRYRVIRKLGWGAFSTVWLCTDNEINDYVAIKIVKSKRSYRESADDEIKVLSYIKSRNEYPFADRVVTLLHNFTFRGINGRHCCLVFEVMGDSLLKFLSTHYKDGIENHRILKLIVRHILEGLCYLHTKCRLIHTDIKPENILFTIDKNRVKGMHSEVENMIGICGESQLPDSFVSVPLKDGFDKRDDKLPELGPDSYHQSSKKTLDIDFNNISLKIADLGNASYIDDYNNFTIQTRPYRSPEVMLGSNFSAAADIWSTACLVFELATGQYLFDYASKDKNYSKNETQLSRMVEMLGPIPKSCRKGKHYNKYFTKTGRLINNKFSEKYSLDRCLIEEFGWEPILATSFAQFLLPMLQLDPRKRATAYDCLNHQWLYN